MSLPILRRTRSVLVVIDVQERLMAAMPDTLRKAMVANVARLARGARALDVPIVLTEQYPRGLGPTLPEVREALGDRPQAIEKVEFSCQRVRPFRDAVERSGKDQLVLCGAEAHICVLQTALDALGFGREVFVAADAICSRRSENRACALDLLRQAGAVPAPTETILFQWLERAGGEAFKEISRLVR